MYGTVFNYKGFMLDAIETKTPNCCVPEYIHDLLYNPTETDFRKRTPIFQNKITNYV